MTRRKTASALPMHMNGRIYDPLLGRFLSADKVVPDPTSLQSFNRYAYVRNNPLTKVDPTGYVDVTAADPYSKLAGPAMTSHVEKTHRALGVDKGVKTVRTETAKAEAIGTLENFAVVSAAMAVHAVASNPANPATWVAAAAEFVPIPKVIKNKIGSFFGKFKKSDAPAKSKVKAHDVETTDSGLDSQKQPEAEGSTVEVSDSSDAAKNAPSNQLLLTAGDNLPNAGGAIRSFVTQSDTTFYRVFSGDSTVGGFLTAVPPRSSAFAREALALPRSNAADLIQEVLVPAGTRLQRSRALPMRSPNDMFPVRRGGAEQFELLDRIPIENFGPGRPLN